MNAPVRTDKMLSRKEGKVGYLTFNNPERHNAVSLEMWEAASGYLDLMRDGVHGPLNENQAHSVARASASIRWSFDSPSGVLMRTRSLRTPP